MRQTQQSILSVIIIFCSISFSINVAMGQEDITFLKLINFSHVEKLDQYIQEFPELRQNGFYFLYACYHSKMEVVSWLADRGFEKEPLRALYLEDSSYYGSALAVAAGEGNFELLTYLIDSLDMPPDVPEYEPETHTFSGWLPLEWASYARAWDCVRFLLTKKFCLQWESFYPVYQNFLENNRIVEATLLIRKMADQIELRWCPFDSSLLASILIRETEIYRNHFETHKAFDLSGENLNRIRELFPEKHPFYTTALAQHSLLCFEYGAYEEAIYYYGQYLPAVIPSGKSEQAHYNNLALCFFRIGDYERAISIQSQLVTVASRSGWSKDTLAFFSYNLALFRQAAGLEEEFPIRISDTLDRHLKNQLLELQAYSHYQKKNWSDALNILSGAVPDTTDLSVANGLWLANHFNTKATLSRIVEDFTSGESDYRRALNYNEVYGNRTLDHALIINNLGCLFYLTGRDSLGFEAYRESFHILDENIQKRFAGLGEREQEKLISLYRFFFDRLFSQLKLTPDNDLAELSFKYWGFIEEIVLRTKRHRLKTMHDQPGHAEIQTYFSVQDLLNNELSRSPALRQYDVNELQNQLTDIERRISLHIIPTDQAVQENRQPGPDDVYLDFFHFRLFNNTFKDSIFYGVFIQKPDGIDWLVLFEERKVSDLFYDLHSAGYHASAIYENPEKFFGAMLIHPLLEVLESYQNIYISPSGILHQINFGGLLPGFRKESDSLSRIILADKLTGEETLPSENLELFLFGGIEYGKSETGLSFWPSLPDSRTEVERISRICESQGFNSTVFTGEDATEYAFVHQTGESGSTNRPYILHFATHGYFFPNPDYEVQEINAFKSSVNPMVRSGVLLTGANAAWGGVQKASPTDGILTAQELSTMDLSDAWLVVLSSCETGLGEIIGYEGVYGLRRALKLAGAGAIILSLWKVSDEHTMLFMESFYTHLLKERQPLREAFRLAQMDIRTQFPDPFYWAAFILIE